MPVLVIGGIGFIGPRLIKRLGARAVTISRFTGGRVLASVFGSHPEHMIPYLADGLVRHVGWKLIFTVGMAIGAQKPLLILTLDPRGDACACRPR